MLDRNTDLAHCGYVEFDKTELEFRLAHNSNSPLWPGVPLALASAVLFGATAPVSKLLLRSIGPWLLAGLLYLGAGIGLAVLRLVRTNSRANVQAPLRRNDIGWIAGVTLIGGVAGPLFLMLGLSRITAATSSLLLNLESLATMAIAWLVFRENVDRRVLLGAVLILAGAIAITWQDGTITWNTGAAFIAAACVCWGIDNNLSRKLSNADPVQIAMLKGLVAGSVNIVIALSLGASLPTIGVIVAAGVTGFIGIGVSLVMFILSLRYLGAARASAYYSIAPFAGVLLAFGVLGEPLSWQVAFGGTLMAGGVFLHLVERHLHEHLHDDLEHEHSHVHDTHHQHVHESKMTEPHSHRHSHKNLRHAHAHFPDLHHRHDH